MTNLIKHLRKYFHNRTLKDEDDKLVNTEFYEQVMGEEGCRRLATCWREYGSELEYLREILEYTQISTGRYSKEEQDIIRETTVRQNKFLEKCLYRKDLDAEYRQVLDTVDVDL